MTKLKKNFIYNIIYQLLNLCLPIITVPYISRTLGATASGIYSYTYSIVNYFMIFGMLGISNYGNRKIAKCRGDKEELSKEFISLYALQFFLTMCSLFIYVLYCIFLSKYSVVCAIEILFLVSTLLDISWLYFGLEEFKKTVTRNILVKLVSLILILVFVKAPKDLYIYTLIMASSTALSQLILWKDIRKYVHFDISLLHIKDILNHVHGVLILFIPVISYSIYKIMDKIMIGLLSFVEEVAYYEYAEKIINIPIGFITALGTVMLPKISNLVANQDSEKVKTYLFKSLKFILFIAIPSCFGLIAVGSDFAVLFLGKDYQQTGTLIQCLAVTIPFTAWANVVRTQWLIPTEKDNIYIGTTIVGALLNLIINLLLIPIYGALGACIGTICSEFLIMFLQSYLSRKEIYFQVIFPLIRHFIFTSILMFITIVILGNYIHSSVLRVVLQTIIGVSVYGLLNIDFIFEILKISRNRKK